MSASRLDRRLYNDLPAFPFSVFPYLFIVTHHYTSYRSTHVGSFSLCTYFIIIFFVNNYHKNVRLRSVPKPLLLIPSGKGSRSCVRPFFIPIKSPLQQPFVVPRWLKDKAINWLDMQVGEASKIQPETERR